MPIKRDLSHLPAAARLEGNPPLGPGQRDLLDELARGWEEDYEDQGLKEKAFAIPEAGPFRGSFMTACERQLHYNMTGAEKTDPPTSAGYWTFQLGQIVHTLIEKILHRQYPGRVKTELGVDLRPIGIPGSASVDAVLYTDETCTTIEANIENKSTNGYGYKFMVGTMGPQAQGPRWSAVVQGAIANQALGSPKLLIPVFSLEVDKKAEGLTKVAAMWEYSAADCAEIVADTRDVIDKVLWIGGEGALPARQIHLPDKPVGAIIRDPDRGMWVTTDAESAVTQTGSTWLCDYCDFNELCKDDGPGGVQVSIL